MLFNSYAFIFAFLPVAVAGFFALQRLAGAQAAIAWLVLASLFFYGWWNPAYLALIGFSILFNYGVGTRLTRGLAPGAAKALLALGVAVNLGLIGYFKYANFFADTLAAATGSDAQLAPIVLPLAISFFTFQQIAYLVDAYRGQTGRYGFLRYALFVTFFPQLIAGPIVHHGEIFPQFARTAFRRLKTDNLAVGLTIFTIGLFKKVVLADGVAAFATPVFDAAAAGAAPSLAEAWCGALAYTFQLYFDFSGYSDMAIGLARIFGLRLPLNFDSPYKATNIIDFWRRWHMTLSRFLRLYLYFPLGGNRKGPSRRYANLLLTMLLGGLWHGAGWTFVVWGGLHGLYLAVNHGWRALRGERPGTRAGRALSWALTFLAVVVGWVLFRAESFPAALAVLEGMAGGNGVLPGPDAAVPFDLDKAAAWLAVLFPITLLAPNTQQIMAAYRPALATSGGEIRPARWASLRWRPTGAWALAGAAGAVVAVLGLARVSEFLYFQF